MANYFTGEGNYTKLVDESNNLISASNPLEVTTLGGALGVVGGGTEATALRVTVANDSTGLLSVDGVELTQISDSLTRVTPSDNVTEAIPVRLMVGTSGATFNALRSVNGDLGVYVDDMDPDAVNNSGMAKASLQSTANASLTSMDGKMVVGAGTEATALRVTVASDSTGVLTVDNPSLSVTGGGLEATAMRVTLASDSTGQVAVASSALPTGAATDALQTSGNNTLSNINTNLTRVAPTDNVTEAIPVRLMVGTSGAAFNALRSVNGDLGVYVDDMNPDAVNNSGAAKASLQTSGNSILSNIDNGLNLGRITNNVYTTDAVSSGDTGPEIIMGDFKDRYGSIHVVGDSSSVGYKFVLEFSTDNTNFYSDGIESLSYLSGGRYQFSVTRTNIGSPYIRIKSIAAGATVNMSYSLTK